MVTLVSGIGGWGEAARPRRATPEEPRTPQGATGSRPDPRPDQQPDQRPALMEEVIATLRVAPAVVWGRGAPLVLALGVAQGVLVLGPGSLPLRRLRDALPRDLDANALSLLAPAAGWAMSATTAVLGLAMVAAVVVRPVSERMGWPPSPGGAGGALGRAALASICALGLLVAAPLTGVVLEPRLGLVGAVAVGTLAGLGCLAVAFLVLPALLIAVPAGGVGRGLSAVRGRRWWFLGVAALTAVTLSVLSAAISAPIALVGSGLGESAAAWSAAIGSLAGSVATVPAAGVVLLVVHARLSTPD